MIKDVLDLLSKNDFINSFEINDDASLSWVETTKVCEDGRPLEVLVDFDEEYVISVVKIFAIPLNDRFFSKSTTICLFLQNQLNAWLQQNACAGSFSLSFDMGKETSFQANLTYCCNILKGEEIALIVKMLRDSIGILIEIVDNIETITKKAKLTPELLDIDDALYIDKINTPEKITDCELFEKSMIFALHPAFYEFLSGIDEEDSKDDEEIDT